MSDIIFNSRNEVIDLQDKSKANLRHVTQQNRLSEGFIVENEELLDWGVVSEKQNITPEMLIMFVGRIKWAKIAHNIEVQADVRLIAKYKGNFDKLFGKETLAVPFLQTYKAFFSWSSIIPRRGQHFFSEELIEELRYVLDPKHITSTQKNNISESYFNHYKNFNLDNFYKSTTEKWIMQQPQYRVNWWKISEFTPLSDDFVWQYWDKLNLVRLLGNHKFSEALMRQIISKDLPKHDLKRIFECQKFSQTFSDEFKYLVS